MSLREEQCKKVCRILDDVLANRPTERDSLIVATRSAFSALSELSTNLAEVGTDCISRQAAIDTITAYPHGDVRNVENMENMVYEIKNLPSAQPERTCVNCGRTANNGGWYADGGTRCPIEEHYALPKDGYCHLWEKRNVTDDDYPEGRADE